MSTAAEDQLTHLCPQARLVHTKMSDKLCDLAPCKAKGEEREVCERDVHVQLETLTQHTKIPRRVKKVQRLEHQLSACMGTSSST